MTTRTLIAFSFAALVSLVSSGCTVAQADEDWEFEDKVMEMVFGEPVADIVTVSIERGNKACPLNPKKPFDSKVFKELSWTVQDECCWKRRNWMWTRRQLKEIEAKKTSPSLVAQAGG
ncbi:MAG: hypothetical protein EXS55_04790 [Candidatus Magasanikbacteria bacterium]|nr:hypothetical protein [Candidatus Magasanikbacteria bacterium]